jgi:hypothetical protein
MRVILKYEALNRLDLIFDGVDYVEIVKDPNLNRDSLIERVNALLDQYEPKDARPV